MRSKGHRRCAATIAASLTIRSALACFPSSATTAAAFLGGGGSALSSYGRFGSSSSAVVRCRHLASSVLREPPPEDDPLRWESMWAEGEMGRSASKKLFAGSPDVDPQSALRSEVRVVTFDLDNTLWKTGNVISAANDELASHLEQKGISAPVRTEVIMGELFKKDKGRYCPLMEVDNSPIDAVGSDDNSHDGESEATNDDEPKSAGVHIKSGDDKPVLLTQLRKDALRDILIRYNDYEADEATQAAEDAFEVWTRARHAAIPSHYAESVVESLERIRSMQTSCGRPVVVGAITDGNSDPRTVPELGPHFDFVVNSESVGVAKPDKRVYMAAVERVASHPDVADIFEKAVALSAGGEMNEDLLLEEAVGPWWVHIGDDFIKDIVAAKELKMRSIWSRELVRKPKDDEPLQQVGATEQGEQLGKRNKNKRDVADLVKELAEMKVVEMYIGADDFLMDSIHREFADAIVDEFVETSTILNDWHEEALRVGSAAMSPIETDSTTDEASEDDVKASIADILTVVVPDEPKMASPAPIAPTPVAAADTKFCVHCGTKLPAVAKFCSSCGEKQSERNLLQLL